MKTNYDNKMSVDLNHVKNLLFQKQIKDWQDQIKIKPKLNFYSSIKNAMEKEKYILINLSRFEKSIISQLRYGILPLRVETGRFRNEKREERICNMCNTNEIEDENHFLYRCTFYLDERELLYNKVNLLNNLNDIEKSKMLFSEHIRQFAKYVKSIYIKRRNYIYK